MSPKASLRADYKKYFYIALLIAVLSHAAAFAFWPEYLPSVYRLPVTVIRVFDVAPIYEVPPKPAEVTPPVVPVNIEPSDDADLAETIGPNFVDLKDLPVVVPPPFKEPSRHIGFDTEPRLLKAVKPFYPELARKAEIEGRVTILVTIDETGRVIAAEVGHSDAEIFIQAAIEAAYKHVFSPAEQNGIPVKATIAVKFKFMLNE